MVTEGVDNLYYTIPRAFDAFANTASIVWTYSALTEKITANITTASVVLAINGQNINPGEVSRFSRPIEEKDKQVIAMEIAHENQDRCRKLLFKIMERRIEGWWD